MEERDLTEFEKAAQRADGRSMGAEFWGFLRHNRKWWLLPIVVLCLLLGLLIVLSQTGLAPFVYTLF